MSEPPAVDVAEVLGRPGRVWHGVGGASEEAIGRLRSRAPAPLPGELLELLRFSDGGEGELALAPMWFVLDSVELILEGLEAPFEREEFPGFVFFGGNGGVERIALDVRGDGPPWPVVMIDPIAGPGSAERIAESMAAFVEAVGLEYVDDEEDA